MGSYPTIVHHHGAHAIDSTQSHISTQWGIIFFKSIKWVIEKGIMTYYNEQAK